MSKKSGIVALILLIIFNVLGIHRFYVGKIGTGLIHLFTCGLFGIGTIVDAICIVTENFEDAEGNKLKFN